MDDLITNDGPDDACFGCGQHNEDGLQMRFRRTGEAAVEATYVVPDRYRGPIGVVHGGIQATLLDEVLGMAIHVGDELDRRRIVTAEFKLRYRRPVPTETELRIRGRVRKVRGPHLEVEGEIVDADDRVLTTAEARWRRLD